MRRIVVNFSCGASSAVAAKIVCAAYSERYEVVVVNFDLSSDEHPDNERFLRDVEKWIGAPVLRLRQEKYQSVEEVWLGEGYLVGPRGASCSRVMKRELGDAFVRPGDLHVLGFTSDEPKRIAAIEANRPDWEFLWVLADAGISKADCLHVLSAAGIDLPAMYLLGYGHNNCIGCCKGGKGYWNRIRVDFPEVFARRAAVQRQMGVQFRSGGKLYFLDELDPSEGRFGAEPEIECNGLFCATYEGLVDRVAGGISLDVVDAPVPVSVVNPTPPSP